MREYSPEELRLLTEVLPNIAQELRGAMTNVYIAANRLAPAQSREENPEIDKNAAIFTQNYYRMYRVVGNLTDAKRLAETGLFTLTNGDLAGLVRSVCERAEPLFQMKGVTLRFDSEQSGHIVAMESELMERLLLNLLSNALKFTPAGGDVSVRVRITGQRVYLTVADTGRGIPPEKLEHVFERFLEADPADPPPHGVGLGLALCRRIAEGHGGSIVVESEEGKGTTFTVSIPNHRSLNARLNSPIRIPPGFNETLVQLSDALPAEAFSHRYLD